MWQVLLGHLITGLNLCPRTSLAETALLGITCWAGGFISGAVVATLAVSPRCRHIVLAVVREFLRPTPVPVGGEDRLAGYRRQ